MLLKRGPQSKRLFTSSVEQIDHAYSIRKLLSLNNNDQGASNNAVVLDDPMEITKYTKDWTQSYQGGSFVCRPQSVFDVSHILAYCNNFNLGVVPQGGNTGLVGGAVGTGTGKEVIISMERMNKIINIDVDARVLYCEAGCILQDLINAAEEKGLAVPLDLGAKGSCMIGGNVSTNAGGLRVVRYGSMHANVLGLEVVLADGTIVDMLRGLRKDNFGYHSHHLFIGSEGTLGVITKVAIQLFPSPSHMNVIICKVILLINYYYVVVLRIGIFIINIDYFYFYYIQLSSYKKLPILLRNIQSQFSEVVSAFEFFDSASLKAISESSPNLLDRYVLYFIM